MNTRSKRLASNKNSQLLQRPGFCWMNARSSQNQAVNSAVEIPINQSDQVYRSQRKTREIDPMIPQTKPVINQ